MSTPEEIAFTDRVKAILDISNTQSETAIPENVAMSSLYAAARYCAFVCTRANGSGAEMAARRDEAMEIFGRQFSEMFMTCYDEFARQFPKA